MVGVPALVRWDLGPSSRTDCPIFLLVSQRISGGPKTKEMTSEVIAASTVRSVI